MRRRLTRVPTQDTKPLAGLARMGEGVMASGGAWVVTDLRTTTVKTSASLGATSVPIRSATGTAKGDVAGIRLSEGLTHWSESTSSASGELALSRPLPGDVAVGAPVTVVRWGKVIAVWLHRFKKDARTLANTTYYGPVRPRRMRRFDGGH